MYAAEYLRTSRVRLLSRPQKKVASPTAIAASDHGELPPLQDNRTAAANMSAEGCPHLLGDLLPKEKQGEQSGEHDLQGQQKRGGRSREPSRGPRTEGRGNDSATHDGTCPDRDGFV